MLGLVLRNEDHHPLDGVLVYVFEVRAMRDVKVVEVLRQILLDVVPRYLVGIRADPVCFVPGEEATPDDVLFKHVLGFLLLLFNQLLLTLYLTLLLLLVLYE